MSEAKAAAPGAEMAPTPEPKARVHLAHLDGLRALAALTVVLHHAWLHSYGLVPHGGLLWRTTHFLAYGRLGVDLFIVLSGFCLTIPVAMRGTLAGGAWSFYRRRARRILPPYYAAAVLTVAIILLMGHGADRGPSFSLPHTPWEWGVEALLLQDAFGTHLAGPFWSIGVECQIYLLFPLLVGVRARFGPLTAAGLAALLALGGFLLTHGTPYYNVTPQFLGLFGLGMLTADVAFSDWGTRWRRLPWGAASATLIALLAALCYRQGVGWIFNHWPPVDVLAGLAAASGLAALAIAPRSAATRALSWKPLVGVGTFAYSIYLLHASLVPIFAQYALNPLHAEGDQAFLLLTAIGTPLIVGASYLFFLAFERPFLSSRKKETPSELARDAALSPAP